MPTLPKIELPKLELPKIDLPKPKAPSFDVTLPAVSPKPFYAGAGVADVAYEAVKEYATGVQKRIDGYRTEATAKFADAKKSVTSFEPKTLPARAKASYADFSGQTKKTVTELQADVRAFPGKAKAKLDETTSSATGTFDDLAKRGEVFVAKLRGKPAPAPVKAPATKTTPAKSTATRTSATTSTTAKKAPAKKAPAKTTTAKKAPAKTTTAKKAPAKKAPAAKKSTAKKA